MNVTCCSQQASTQATPSYPVETLAGMATILDLVVTGDTNFTFTAGVTATFSGIDQYGKEISCTNVPGKSYVIVAGMRLLHSISLCNYVGDNIMYNSVSKMTRIPHRCITRKDWDCTVIGGNLEMESKDISIICVSL